MYSFLYKQIGKSYTKNTLIENYQKILITMTPIIPHFSNECLNIIGAKEFRWPEYDKSMLKENIINIVIQINGKKRGIIEAKRDISEKNLLELIFKDEKINKYIEKKEIIKKIFIPNKLMNIII